nr:hypothetical protein [uncultured Kingella sp.]
MNKVFRLPFNQPQRQPKNECRMCSSLRTQFLPIKNHTPLHRLFCHTTPRPRRTPAQNPCHRTTLFPAPNLPQATRQPENKTTPKQNHHFQAAPISAPRRTKHHSAALQATFPPHQTP